MPANVSLEGPRVTVRTLQREDLEQMEKWRPSSDPLQALWSVSRSTAVSRAIWYAMYVADATRMWFAVERRDDRRVIGTLSLREIVDHTNSRLGIGFGPDYVDQGYGSESLRLFLPHYFRTLGFAKLVLDVAGPNRRAVHVYEKLGFQYTGSHHREVAEDVDLSFLNQECYHGLRIYFRKRFGRMQILFYDMALDRIDWERRIAHTTLS